MKLAPLFEEMVTVIGLAAAVKLVEARGGQRIFVPRKVPAGHWLAELLGLTKANQLAQHFNHQGGNHIDLPAAARLHQAQRNAMIAKMAAEKKSANEIAAAANITRRHVFRLVDRINAEPTDNQPDFFAKG